MKFLQIDSIESINDILSEVPIGTDQVFVGKIEAYSCKRAGSDKKLYKILETAFQIELSKTPPSPDFLSSQSPFGPLSIAASRNTLINLIATLNSSFPDYEFSDLKPEQFRKENSIWMIKNSVDTLLSASIEGYNGDLKDKLWKTIDQEISLADIDIYSYIPDLSSDPFSEEGSIWSFNYFFYNKNLKRVIFFTGRSLSSSVFEETKKESGSDGEYEESWTYEDQVFDEMDFD